MTFTARLLCCAMAALTAGPAWAGSIRVDPVQISVNKTRRTAAVTIVNAAAEPVMVRAYPLAWAQPGGDDVYSETAAVIVSPPIATIPARGRQLVRVGFRDPAAAKGAWRLVVEEVPQASLEGGGVQVALRFNLPLFAQLEAGKPGDLNWSARRGPDGNWTLEADNPGPGYVRLGPADFGAATGVRHTRSIRLGVVLPNSRRRWRLEDQPDVIDRTRFERIARRENLDDRPAVDSPRD